MNLDAIRLNAIYAALSRASETYLHASRAVSGSAYGVELRTLASARRAMAQRFHARLRDMGAHIPEVTGPGYVSVATLVEEPRSGAAAMLEGERMLIADLDDSSRHASLSPESRQLVLSALSAMRAHAFRVQGFLQTL